MKLMTAGFELESSEWKASKYIDNQWSTDLRWESETSNKP